MIPVGYEVGTGKRISIPLGHLVVTGQTQLSGKTTTLEALITRSKLKAVAFITKRGESSFRTAKLVRPYWSEPANDPEQPLWLWVQSILESTAKHALRFEQSWIIKACEYPRAAKSLAGVHSNIRALLDGEGDYEKKGKKKVWKWRRRPVTGLNEGVYTSLDAYFKIVLPQLERLPFTSKLDLQPGLSVMDLSDYTFQLQSLVIRSVLEWVYQHETDTIVIIPEAWEFIPQGRGSPVRMAAEVFARKAAAEHNFLWIDSQDIAGVEKVLFRGISVWLFGVQREVHELKRTLNHIPQLAPKPSPQEIATLGKGQFMVVFGNEIRKVYVQPEWLNELDARAIALGEDTVESALRVMREKDRAAGPRPRQDVASAGTLAEEGRAPAPAGMLGKVVKAVNGAVQAYFHDQEPPDEEKRNEETSSDTTPASGRRRAGNQVVECADTAIAAEGDETMWKEKFEALEIEHKQLIEAHDELAKEVARFQRIAFDAGSDPDYDPRKRSKSSSTSSARDETRQKDGGEREGGTHPPERPALPLKLVNFDGDGIYNYIRKRAQEDPGILELLTQRPELRVRVERPVVEFHGNQLDGRIAQLIAEGFFGEPRDRQAVGTELKRRGVLKATSNLKILSPFLAKLAKLGFLTIEADGYRAVAGMKVQIIEKESP